MLTYSQRRKIRINKPNWNRPSFKDKKYDMVRLYESATGNTLKRNGKVWIGICPFHSENKGSFAIYPDTDSYYCFGCEASGTSGWLKKKLGEL